MLPLPVTNQLLLAFISAVSLLISIASSKGIHAVLAGAKGFITRALDSKSLGSSANTEIRDVVGSETKIIVCIESGMASEDEIDDGFMGYSRFV